METRTDAMHERSLSQDLRVLREANRLPKHSGARTPFGPIDFIVTRTGCWATCPTTGFGYHYPDLLEAVQSWCVALASVCLNDAGEVVFRGEIAGEDSLTVTSEEDGPA